MANSAVQEKVVNGVHVDQMMNMIELVKQQPELAQFKFRATNHWVHGTHNCATIEGFYGAGKEDASRDPMRYEMDEPILLCGNSLGANPVELLLVALSGCVTTSLITQASASDIELRGVESHYEGDIDLRGFMGVSEDVPVEYQAIRMLFKIDADLSIEQKEELLRKAKKYSPVYNSISNPVSVSIELDHET